MKKLRFTIAILFAGVILAGCSTSTTETKKTATQKDLTENLEKTIKAETSVYVAAIKGNDYQTEEMIKTSKKVNSQMDSYNKHLKKTYAPSKKLDTLIKYNKDVKSVATNISKNESWKDIYNSVSAANKLSYNNFTKKKGYKLDKQITDDFYVAIKEYNKIYSNGVQKSITYPSRHSYNLSDGTNIKSLASKYVYGTQKDASWSGADVEIEGVSINTAKPFSYEDSDENTHTGHGFIMVSAKLKAKKDLNFFTILSKAVTSDGQQLDAAKPSDNPGEMYSGASKKVVIFFYVPKMKSVNSISNIRFILKGITEESLDSKEFSFNINLNK